MGNLLPNKDKFLRNFSCCDSWEEKYLYLIELGGYLPSLPSDEMRTSEYLIPGCQSQVWIVIAVDEENKRNVHLYGDSDASIVKGLIATVFIFYHGLTLLKITDMDIYPFFNQLALTHHITPSRVHGLEAIVRAIRCQASALLLSSSRSSPYERYD